MHTHTHPKPNLEKQERRTEQKQNLATYHIIMEKQRKTKLNKHIKTHTKQINKRKTKLSKENKARRARSFTSKTKAPWLDFDNSPQSNKEVISNLKTPRSRPKEASIKKILT